MPGTYASSLLIVAASALVGQAVFAACGRREWSFLAPAVGLAALTGIAWGTVRLPGEGTAAAIAVGIVALVSALVLVRTRGAVADREQLAIGIAVAVLGFGAASLPFAVEGRFGILGTGLNPDMSQHLFAASQLAHGEGGRLLAQGYPLGPHAVVAAVSAVCGASLVHAFDGLQLAIAVCAALAPLGLLRGLAPAQRVGAALLVGLPYLAASYLIQGAFKETMQALFVLAFAIALQELANGRLLGGWPVISTRRALAGVPLATLAVGSVYCYSFPGLLWLAGATAAWAAIELAIAARRFSFAAAIDLASAAAPATVLAAAVLAACAAPEIGGMVDFAGFQTFDPRGPGLGNLFNPISPLEALGIWPSGDFRLDPGDGAMPVLGFYLGELLGLVALLYGLVWWLRRAQRAVPGALAVAAALYAYAHFAGTPYQAAKSIVIAAPLAILVIVRALLSGEPVIELGGLRSVFARRRGGADGVVAHREPLLRRGLALAFVALAAGCSAVALANGPVGPSTYSPKLTELRPELGKRSTLVLASKRVLDDEHGRDYLVWELRGGRVCVAQAGPPSSKPPPPGISHVITQAAGARAPYAALRPAHRSGPYTVWARRPAPRGSGPCPLISVGGRANPASG